MNGEQHRKTHQNGGAPLSVSDQPVVGTKWLLYHDHNHTRHVQARSSQKSSRCHILARQKKKQGMSCRKRSLCRKSSTHSQTPVTIFTIKVNRAKEPQSRLLRGLCTGLPASHVFQVGLEHLKVDSRRQTLEPVFVEVPPNRDGGQWCQRHKKPCRGTVDRNPDAGRDPSYVEHLTFQVCQVSHGATEHSLSLVPKPSSMPLELCIHL